MLTEQQYATVVFTASRANAVLTQSIRNKEALGCYPKWNLAQCQSLKIKSGYFSLNVQDYSSVASVDIYNQLLDIGSTWTGGIVFDPNYDNPTSPIVIVNGSAFGYVKSGNIAFSGTGEFTITLANWQTAYAPIYGQSPEILLFTLQSGIFQQDTQTEIIKTYAVTGDATSPLQSISWTYPVDTVGYYTISGTVPGASPSGPSTGSGSTYFLVYAGDSGISYDGDNNFVYRNPVELVGKSGYYISILQNNQSLVDGIGIQSNPVVGSFTILDNPGFVLDPNYPIIVNVR